LRGDLYREKFTPTPAFAGVAVLAAALLLIVVDNEPDAALLRGRGWRHELANGIDDARDGLVVATEFPLQEF
jgi:hypothetical protein